MKYMGSKSRIAKDIVPIIQKCINDNNIDIYIEPFVGGANIIDKIKCKMFGFLTNFAFVFCYSAMLAVPYTQKPIAAANRHHSHTRRLRRRPGRHRYSTAYGIISQV